jgi:hypothetical protein
VNLSKTLLICCAASALAVQAATLITFEGLADQALVGDYYNGGAGGRFGVSFNKRFQAIVDPVAGGGTVASIRPGAGSSAIINVLDGFDTSLTLSYSGPGTTVVLYDKPNARGTQLSFATLNPTPAGALLSPATIRFEGRARSILFGFVGYRARQTFIDNLTLGDAGPSR